MNKVLLLISLAISGCAQWEPLERPEQLGETGAASCLSRHVADTDVGVWLAARPCVCEASNSPMHPAELHAENRAYQVLFLLQASCFTQQLRQTDIEILHSIYSEKFWDARQKQLIALVLEQVNTVEKLNTEVNTLTDKLKSTIQGIHSIESDINELDTSE